MSVFITERGNAVDISDCVLNSLEIGSPFVSFYNEKIGYSVSYYFSNKFFFYESWNDDEWIPFAYWDGFRNGRQRVAEALAHQQPVEDFHQMPPEYYTEAIKVILEEMDALSDLAAEELALRV